MVISPTVLQAQPYCIEGRARINSFHNEDYDTHSKHNFNIDEIQGPW
jgi:hypothetical protein